MAKEKTDTLLIVNSGELGELLLKYREKSGFSLIQMADALCLSEETIKNLENEDFESLPEPPYIRGYLRNYAKIADSDPSELVNRYEALRGADPSELNYHFRSSSPSNSNTSKQISPVMAQLFFLALLIIVLAGISMIPGINKWITETWDSFSDQTSSLESISTDNPLLTGAMPNPIPLPFDENPSKQTPDLTENSQSSDKPNTTETPQAENSDNKPEVANTESTTNETENTNTQEQTKKEAEAVKEEEETSTDVTKSDIINIKLVFNKEVWLRIRDKNKKTLFEATNSAGEEKILNLKKPLTFRVGNAQGLSLFVDNKAVDISGYIKGSVANFTLE